MLFSNKDLELIRDAHVDDVVDFILSIRDYIGESYTIFELVLHGNYQKAALVVKELERKSPESQEELYNGCGPDLMHMLINMDLLKLPRNLEQARNFFRF